jgi:hypothetical protein
MPPAMSTNRCAPAGPTSGAGRFPPPSPTARGWRQRAGVQDVTIALPTTREPARRRSDQRSAAVGVPSRSSSVTSGSSTCSGSLTGLVRSNSSHTRRDSSASRRRRHIHQSSHLPRKAPGVGSSSMVLLEHGDRKSQQALQLERSSAGRVADPHLLSPVVAAVAAAPRSRSEGTSSIRLARATWGYRFSRRSERLQGVGRGAPSSSLAGAGQSGESRTCRPKRGGGAVSLWRGGRRSERVGRSDMEKRP